jgi:uroporphyrinogen decarboxylase
MNPRERVQATLSFQPVDKIPLQIHPSPGGLYDHGQKLLDLMRACGHDFDDQRGLALPVVPKEDFDPDGRYHRVATDEWGTTWNYRIYGVWGHRIKYPLENIARLAHFRPPAIEKLGGEALAQAQAEAAAHRQTYYQLGGGVSLFETMQSLRPYEDLLIDITDDTSEINHLADLLMDYYAVVIENALAIGVDAVMVGDDFGTQQALILSPKTWRRFFLPRYRTLFVPIKRAGKRIVFHSCGKVEPLLVDLQSVGVDAIWPQLPLFDANHLAQLSRELGLALMLHPDRGELMQRGTPQQVRDYLLRLVDDYSCLAGGSWLYLEVDPGFAWSNVQAMFETAMALRQ